MTKKSECIQKTHKMMDEIWEESSGTDYMIIIEVDGYSFEPCKTKYPHQQADQILQFYIRTKKTSNPVYFYYPNDNLVYNLEIEKERISNIINRMVKWI